MCAPARILILITVATYFATSAVRAQEPLRYRFETGDWLIYERRVEALAGGAAGNTAAAPRADQIEVWCLDAKVDANLLLIDHVPPAGQRGEWPRGVLLKLDQRGMPTLSDEMVRTSAEMEFLYDVLPITQSPFDGFGAWRTSDVPGRTPLRCTWVGADADVGGAIRVDFAADQKDAIVEVSGYHRDGAFWMDKQRGVLQRIVYTEQFSDGRRNRVTIALRHRVKNDEQWCVQRGDEATGFLRRAMHQDGLLDSVLAGESSVEDAITRNTRSWTAYIKDLHARVKSPFQSLAEGRIRRLQAAAGELTRLRQYVERVRGKPAGSWSLQDVGGVTQNSEMLRRGWTVECFWSAKNLAALRMLETMRRLRDEVARYAERAPTAAGREISITIIGLNVDADPDLAKRAITQCGGGMPQLLAESLTVMDPLPELPYARLIDPSGRVRAVYFGWRPTIGQSVIDILNEK